MKNYWNYIFICFCFLFCFLGVYRVYRYKVDNFVLYQYQANYDIELKNEKISLVYLISSVDEFDRNIMNLGGLFRYAENNHINLYFVVQNKMANKLQEIFDVHDISENIFLANNLMFWLYSYGNEPTLLIFKRGKMIGSIYGCKNWNLLNEIRSLERVLV